MARVGDLMRKDVSACREDQAMNEAARIMWERDCGFVPVVASDDSGKLVGVVTDRDLCMAAYTRGKSLAELCVADAMSRDVRTCTPEDPLSRAETEMRVSRVRRLPVVDEQQHIYGVVTLDDLLRHLGSDADRLADTVLMQSRHFPVP